MGLDQYLKREVLVEQDEAYWRNQRWLDDIVAKVCEELGIANEHKDPEATCRRYRLTSTAIVKIGDLLRGEEAGKFYGLLGYAEDAEWGGLESPVIYDSNW